MPELDTDPGGLFAVGSLLSYYRFQGTSRDQKGTNHGTDNGSPSYVTGKFGKAIEFTGSSTKYVNLGNVLNVTGNFSVSVWIKPTALGDTLVYAKDVAGSRGFGFGITSGGEIYSEKGGVGLLTSTGAGIVAGQWVHIVQTYNGTTWLQYRNAVQVGTVAGSAIPSSTADVNIGRRTYTGSEQPFNGLVDDLSIYNVALSATEIFTLYKQTGNNLTNYRQRKRTPGAVSE